MTLEVTKGDTKHYTLRFNVDVSQYKIYFVIKDKHEDVAYLHKVEALKVGVNVAVATLDSELTGNLDYRAYPFGVVMVSEGGVERHTLMKGMIKVTWRVL